jgi:hypothetical protein
VDLIVITCCGAAAKCTGVPQLSTETVVADCCGCCAGVTAAVEHPARPAETTMASAAAPIRCDAAREDMTLEEILGMVGFH